MIEKTHITKMLELVNSGTISKYRGKTLDDITLDDLIIAATHDEPIDEDDDEELDDINSNNIEHDTLSPNVSNDIEVVSEPSSSTFNPSLQVKPKVNLNKTPHVNTKRTRCHWPESIKSAIRKELGDCIITIQKLSQERATAFLEKYNLQDRTFNTLKNVVYNMGRKDRK